MRTAVCLFVAGSLSMAQQIVPPGYISLGFTPRAAAPGMRVEELGPAPRTYKISLRKGDEIMSALAEFARDDHIEEGHFSGIGAIDSGVFGWYDPAKHADRRIPVNSEAEIVSLIGDIAKDKDGEPKIHAHIAVAFGDGSVKGGHLFEARISLMGEIYVTATAEKPGYNASGF